LTPRAKNMTVGVTVYQERLDGLAVPTTAARYPETAGLAFLPHRDLVSRLGLSHESGHSTFNQLIGSK
jgi:hypothetical protein